MLWATRRACRTWARETCVITSELGSQGASSYQMMGELSEAAEGGSSLLKDGREAESGFGPGTSRCKGTSSPYARI